MNVLNDKRLNIIERLRWMVLFRLAAVIFILSIYITVNALKIMNFPLAPFIILCLIEGFLNQPYPFVVNRVKDLNRLAYIHLVADLVLISGIIHYLGGIEFSFFNALYPLIIIGSAMILSRDFVFKLATLSSLAFAVVVALEHYGVLPHTAIFGLNLFSQFQIVIVLANIIFFYFIAFLSTYSSNVLEQKGKEIEKQRDWAEGLLSMMMDGLVILDENGMITKVNDSISKLLGYCNEELVGKPMLETICAEADRPRVKEILISLHIQKSLKDIELDLLKKGGGAVPIRLNAVDLACSRRSVKGSFLVFHDTTSERESEKIKSAFLSNISHELNTPLSVIKGFTQTMLEKREIAEPERNEFLKIMDEEIDRLERIIEDLMDMARMEIGWIKIKKEKGQLIDVLREVAGKFADEARRKKLLYHINLPEQMSPVYFDRENIKRVISRLLENAFKYTDSGEISIEAEEDANKVLVSVGDTGRIIEEKELVNIFNMFCDDGNRYAGLRKMNIKLPVIKHIVEAHGGSIWVRSLEGQGTKFSFALPREA